MKNYLFIIVLLVCSFQEFLCFGQNSKVVLYREYNLQGSAVSYKVYANDSLVIKLKNASYYVYNCTPGEYRFRINNYKVSDLKLNVEDNRTYYIRSGMRMGVWSGIPELLLVDSLSAYPAISGGSLYRLDGSNTPMIRPKNRFGLNIAMGFGFDNFPMFLTTDDEKSKISFGGGYAFGAKYGREFNKYFDLAFDLNYQFSDLRPPLKNADVTFKRGVLSVTPSYIIPISGGDAMRIKLGGGPDYYWSNKLSIEGSKVPNGFDDDWDYKNSWGFHLSAVYEFNFTEKWSFNYGLKWYNVKYEFESGGDYAPDVKELSNPDGSGIDLLFGMYYHF